MKMCCKCTCSCKLKHLLNQSNQSINKLIKIISLSLSPSLSQRIPFALSYTKMAAPADGTVLNNRLSSSDLFANPDKNRFS